MPTFLLPPPVAPGRRTRKHRNGRSDATRQRISLSYPYKLIRAVNRRLIFEEKNSKCQDYVPSSEGPTRWFGSNCVITKCQFY